MFLSHVTHIIDDTVLAIPANMKLGELARLLRRHQGEQPPVAVITDDGVLLGVVTRGLEPALKAPHRPVSRIAKPPACVVDAVEGAFDVVSKMLVHGLDVVAVLKNGKFEGLVTRRSVTQAFGELTAV
jgi:CBS domain-containing protein